jgi:hypothetical protein
MTAMYIFCTYLVVLLWLALSLFNVLQAIITDNLKQAITTWTSKLPPPALSITRAKNRLLVKVEINRTCEKSLVL